MCNGAVFLPLLVTNCVHWAALMQPVRPADCVCYTTSCILCAMWYHKHESGKLPACVSNIIVFLSTTVIWDWNKRYQITRVFHVCASFITSPIHNKEACSLYQAYFLQENLKVRCCSWRCKPKMSCLCLIIKKNLHFKRKKYIYTCWLQIIMQ